MSNPRSVVAERVRKQLRSDRDARRVGENIRRALKTQGTSRWVEENLGYSLDGLRDHIERQFARGMTWEKFQKGLIHIDHIRPLSQFDLSDPDEVRDAWTLTNLRPLWAKDNMSKGAKLLHLI